MYLQNALSGAPDPQLEQASTAYDRQIDHLNNAASALHQPRAIFEAAPSTYRDFDFRKAFPVWSYSPKSGNEGARVCVYLESISDLISPTALTANLMFASCVVPATWTLDATKQHDCFKYFFNANAPPFSETGSSVLKIPLHLQLKDNSRPDTNPIYIGDWLYEGGKHLGHHSSTPEASLTEKVTDEPSGTSGSAKCTTSSEQQTAKSQDYASYALAYPRVLDFSTMQRRHKALGRLQLQRNFLNKADTMRSQDLTGSTSIARSVTRHSLGQTSLWNSLYGAEYESSNNPQPTTATSFQVTSTSTPGLTFAMFVRLSLIQKPSRRRSAGSSPDAGPRPYPLSINPAVLVVQGYLDAMAMQANWTPEERAVKRRLVRFWRQHNGTTINVYFRPLRADERSLPHDKNERRISCIYCEKEDKCYITSVDTIFLLELLVDYREFHTNEKNRVRRNLESFDPETVSKSKPEKESLFELIMGFSDPKPSKIKKDVKVFDWSNLEQALNKVVSKYVHCIFSAEDARLMDVYRPEGPILTAGAIGPQPDPNFSGAQSPAGTGGASAAYAPTPESINLTPPTAPQSLPSYSRSSPLQPVSVVSLANSHTVPALGLQYMPNHTFSPPYVPQVSVPGLSPAYSTSDISPGRSSEASTEDLLTPTSDYYSSRPNNNAYYASQYASQGFGEATATLGLPGRASEDLSAYLNNDVASSSGIGDADYRRQSDLNDETRAMQFKEE